MNITKNYRREVEAIVAAYGKQVGNLFLSNKHIGLCAKMGAKISFFLSKTLSSVWPPWALGHGGTLHSW